MKHLSNKTKDRKSRKWLRKKSKKNRPLKNNLHVALLPKISNGSSNWDQLSKIIGQHITKEKSETKTLNRTKFKHPKRMHTDNRKKKNHDKQSENDSSQLKHSAITNLTDKNASDLSSSKDCSSVSNSSESKHTLTNDDLQMNQTQHENKVSSKKKKKYKSIGNENFNFILPDRKGSSEVSQKIHDNNSIKSPASVKNTNLTSEMNVLHLQNKDSKKKNEVHSKPQNINLPQKKNSTNKFPKHNSTDTSPKRNSTDKSSSLDKQHPLTKVIAMDCEMVGTGLNGEDSMLARVSLVNKWGDCIYDAYVKPMDIITDYRTPVSGIRPSDLAKGKDLFTVQKEVQEILDGRILVGHALKNDLSVLFMGHPQAMIRDTSKYRSFRQLFNGQTPSLKKLTEKVLGVQIQTGEHNSIEDAQAAMQIYLTHKREWEDALKYHRKKRHKRPSLSQQTL